MNDAHTVYLLTLSPVLAEYPIRMRFQDFQDPRQSMVLYDNEVEVDVDRGNRGIVSMPSRSANPASSGPTEFGRP